MYLKLFWDNIFMPETLVEKAATCLSTITEHIAKTDPDWCKHALDLAKHLYTKAGYSLRGIYEELVTISQNPAQRILLEEYFKT